MANLYTKTGDGGTTALAGGSRVKKDSPQVWCYGTVDEANAFLGMAYALSQEDFLSQNIDAIQHKLFLLAAELACDERGKERLGENVIQEEDVEWLENLIDQCTEQTGVQTGFVIPGVNLVSAALHMARTVIRRSERLMTAAKDSVKIRPLLLRYSNRLSDGIYALARWEECRYCRLYGSQKERNFRFERDSGERG